MHLNIDLIHGYEYSSFIVTIEINSKKTTKLHMICPDMGPITSEYYMDADILEDFNKNTETFIPVLYYFNHDKTLEDLACSSVSQKNGINVVLKSCNRCGRFLPIDMENQLNTVCFSVHCKKRAPCTHNSFSNYEVINLNDLDKAGKKFIDKEDNRVHATYGYQIECRACKKFFVNKPLNPQRTPQQHREDGIRRRATEVLVNNLLGTNIIHQTYKFDNPGHEFTEDIWMKFEKKCFKCGKKLNLKDVALDHTMPIAYLYRLDETATCLCGSCNSKKSDNFPIDFYTETELTKLSQITGLNMNILHSRNPNKHIVKLLKDDIVWFFDKFLMKDEYQKTRSGILTADKIFRSVQRVVKDYYDLVAEYEEVKGSRPFSISDVI